MWVSPSRLGGNPGGVRRGLTVGYFCVIMLTVWEMLGFDFGLAGRFFFCEIFTSREDRISRNRVSRLICSFMGLPPMVDLPPDTYIVLYLRKYIKMV